MVGEENGVVIYTVVDLSGSILRDNAALLFGTQLDKEDAEGL